jgi:hypothetical protein
MPEPHDPAGFLQIRTEPLARRAPSEPWYYGFLWNYIFIILLGGLVSGVGTIAAGVYSLPTSVPFGLILIGSGIGTIGLVLLVTAPLFLLVDAARNLRAIRYNKLL